MSITKKKWNLLFYQKHNCTLKLNGKILNYFPHGKSEKQLNSNYRNQKIRKNRIEYQIRTRSKNFKFNQIHIKSNQNQIRIQNQI